eukprot:TRINITY_DN10011_c0_g1_i4.p1 TRINITY_DN10011_c0_g1~~TRINITY_DN10011_c0_g1_i4.p1  ORF type:complete len:465 (+),score=30.24 TRINITY_DN10011_c0_g1_i4:79-1473(+)
MVGGSQTTAALVLGAAGSLIDFFDLQVINLIRPELESDYGSMTPREDALLTASAIIGTITGMFFFGIMADHIGRRGLFVFSATLIGFFAFASACAVPVAGLSLYEVLSFCRFVMGMGIGGEYSLVGSIVAESVDAYSSTRSLMKLFGTWVIGLLLPPYLILFLSGHMGIHGSMLWRIALGFGAIVGLVVAALRWYLLEESQVWDQERSRSVTQIEESLDETCRPERLKALMAMKRTLTGTSVTYFLDNIEAFGISLYSTRIFDLKPGVESGLVLAPIEYVGCIFWIAMYTLANTLSLKQFQCAMSLSVASLYIVMSFTYTEEKQQSYSFFLAYACMRGVHCWNITMMIFPCQVYPTFIRTTATGISSACGKVGAMLGALSFPYLHEHAGMHIVFASCAFLQAAGALCTHMCLPSYDMEMLEEVMMIHSDTNLNVEQQAIKTESYFGGETRQNNFKEMSYGTNEY